MRLFGMNYDGYNKLKDAVRCGCFAHYGALTIFLNLAIAAPANGHTEKCGYWASPKSSALGFIGLLPTHQPRSLHCAQPFAAKIPLRPPELDFFRDIPTSDR